MARGLLALAFAGMAISLASAHTAKDLEGMLHGREKFFQPIDKPAPEFALRDADGGSVRLSDFRGKVVVLHFIYTRCPDVCPLHAERIAQVQAMVNRTPMKELVQFVTVTTDPANDGGPVLRDFGAAHGLDAANWSFLTTSPDQSEDTTRRLAAAYGHKFAKTDDGYQLHGIVTHVIDREGRWRANFHGLKFDPANLVLLVNALANDLHAPVNHSQMSWWNRMRALF